MWCGGRHREVRADCTGRPLTLDASALEREWGPETVKETQRPGLSHLSPRLPQVPADGGSPGASQLLLQDPVLSCVPHCYAQEVSRLCHLSAGAYRIVPSTYLPDTEGAFTVTIATRIDRWGFGAGASPPACSPRPPRAGPSPQSSRARAVSPGTPPCLGACGGSRAVSGAAGRGGGLVAGG